MRPALLLAVTIAASPKALAAQDEPRVRLIDTAVIASPRIPESSGAAASFSRLGVYWTHNDSGDGPLLYAIDSAGHDLGAVRVAAAGAEDWEDLAAGPCPRIPGRCLYIADIGDNRRRRAYVVVYVVPEPSVPASVADTTIVQLVDSVVLRYPDGPRDAEALVVTPAGRILVVSKPPSGPPVLYRVHAVSHIPAELERVGTLAIDGNLLRGRRVTGAALSPDGELLVVRTYSSLHFFRLAGDSVPQPLSSPAGVTIPVVESQGEAVTFDRANRLLLTSEQGDSGHAILTRLEILGRQP